MHLYLFTRFRATEILLGSTLSISQVVLFAPSFTAAIVGVHRLFQIIDRKPVIKSPNETNKFRDHVQNHNIEG